MTRLQRYVLNHFLRPLIISYATLLMLTLVAEMLERLDKLMAAKASLAIVAHYLILLVPIRTMEVLPLAALLALLLALGTLSRRQEITAALAGGVHPWTLIQPLILTGLLLSCMAYVLNDKVVPRASAQAQRLWNDDIRRVTDWRTSRYDHVVVSLPDHVFLATALLDLSSGKMTQVFVEWTVEGRPRRNITASSATWTGTEWYFFQGVDRKYDLQKNSLLSQKLFQNLRPGFREKPQDVAPRAIKTDILNLRQTKEALLRLRQVGAPSRRVAVDYHLKMAFPWAGFVVVLLGVSFGFQKRGGHVVAVSLALATAFLYFGLLQVGRALGQKPWVAPWVGAWLANGTFALLASVMLFKIRRRS